MLLPIHCSGREGFPGVYVRTAVGDGADDWLGTTLCTLTDTKDLKQWCREKLQYSATPKPSPQPTPYPTRRPTFPPTPWPTRAPRTLPPKVVQQTVQNPPPTPWPTREPRTQPPKVVQQTVRNPTPTPLPTRSPRTPLPTRSPRTLPPTVMLQQVSIPNPPPPPTPSPRTPLPTRSPRTELQQKVSKSKKSKGDCEDAPDTTKFLVGSFQGEKTCSWLRDSHQVIQDWTCVQGEAAWDLCRLTCDRC